MGWLSFIPIVGKIVDKIFPSKEKKQDLLIEKEKTRGLVETEKLKQERDPASIVLEEAGGNILQRSWRPLLIYMFLIVLANNMLLVPLTGYYFGWNLLYLDFPTDIPDILTYAVTGYMGLRTVEKMTNKSG